MSAHSNGWRAESFVLKERAKMGGLVIPLAPSFPADLLHLMPTMKPLFIEVKGARRRWDALHGARSRLSWPELELRRVCLQEGEYDWMLYRVQTFPGGDCVVVSVGTDP